MTYIELAQIITSIAALVGSMAAAAAFVASLRNGAKITDVHIAINSRMDQLLRTTANAEHARGAKEERDNAQAANGK